MSASNESKARFSLGKRSRYNSIIACFLDYWGAILLAILLTMLAVASSAVTFEIREDLTVCGPAGVFEVNHIKLEDWAQAQGYTDVDISEVPYIEADDAEETAETCVAASWRSPLGVALNELVTVRELPSNEAIRNLRTWRRDAAIPELGWLATAGQFTLPIAMLVICWARVGSLRGLLQHPPRYHRAHILGASTLTGAALAATILVGMLLLARWLDAPPPKEPGWLKSGPWGVLALGVLAAPVAEELFFRRHLLGRFIQQGYPTLGLTVTTALFVGIHLYQVLLMTGGANLTVILTLLWIALVGLVLGVLYRRTEDVLPCILLHAAYNAVLLGYALLFWE